MWRSDRISLCTCTPQVTLRLTDYKEGVAEESELKVWQLAVAMGDDPVCVITVEFVGRLILVHYTPFDCGFLLVLVGVCHEYTVSIVF